jgi:hypothetical protein
MRGKSRGSSVEFASGDNHGPTGLRPCSSYPLTQESRKGQRVLTRGLSRARESESLFARRLGCKRKPGGYVCTPNDLCERERRRSVSGVQNPGKSGGNAKKVESHHSRLVVLTRG